MRCDACPFRFLAAVEEPTASTDDYIARPANFWEGFPDHLPHDFVPRPPLREGFDFDEVLNAPRPLPEVTHDDVRAVAGDAVDHPSHYARWAMEPIAFIAINNLPWWLANVIKYTMRFDAKDGIKDLYKARSYLDMKIRHLEGEPNFWLKPVAQERRLNNELPR